MWRALAVGVAYQDRKQKRKREPDGDHTKVDKRYKKICRRGSRLQTQLAKTLKEETKTDEGTFDAMLTISNHVQRNITVINIDTRRFVKYRTRDQRVGAPFEKTLYLLNRPEEKHYDAITSITGFFGCSYYCEPCNVRSTVKNKHRCPNSKRCRVCHREPEEHTQRIVELKCDHCYRLFYDQGCYDVHQEKGGMCHKSWK